MSEEHRSVVQALFATILLLPSPLGSSCRAAPSRFV
nr:MAG TPA: hypothetical protein [Caudoviricetes sp.]